MKFIVNFNYLIFTINAINAINVIIIHPNINTNRLTVIMKQIIGVIDMI